MNVTIKDIARQANVSIATVSRILSGKTEFNSEKTINRIQALAKKMGYQKNTAAVELVTQTSKVIAVIVSENKTNFANKIIEGIHDESYKNGLNVIIIYASQNDSKRQLESIKTVVERQVKGILLIAMNLSDDGYSLLKQVGKPYVFLSISNDRNLSFISSDDYLIGYQATKYLINKGHENIAIAGLDVHSYIGKKRIEGYRHALEESGITPFEKWIINGSFSYEDGFNTLKRLGKISPVTGIIACSDFVALGVINQASAWNIRIPKDLSIISVDGTEICKMVKPAITSVTQSFYEMGTLGVNYLMNHSHDNSYKKITTIKIETRQSTSKKL